MAFLQTGLYTGGFRRGEEEFKLQVRVSADLARTGASALYLDAFSGDIFLHTDAKQENPLSFRCEHATVEMTGEGLAVSGLAETYLSGTKPLFPQNNELNVSITFTSGGKTLFEIGPADNSQPFLQTQIHPEQPFFRALDVHFAVLSGARHSTAPKATIGNQLLDVGKVFDRAGIRVNLPETPQALITAQNGNTSWSNSELNDTLEEIFRDTTLPEKWPDWRCFGLVLDRYEQGNHIAGVTFDDRAPGNQGFAVFMDHPYFRGNFPDENMLYTWVHEIGHILGLPHPDRDSPPERRTSWMDNNDHSDSGFKRWESFPGDFSDYDKYLLRHNFHLYVIPGYRVGGTEALSSRAVRHAPGERHAGHAGVELLIRGQEQFYTGEPVEIEVRLKNLGDGPRTVTTCLFPEEGFVEYQVQRKGRDRWMDYRPFIRYLVEAQETVLAPTEEGHRETGRDRFSQMVSIMHGVNGIPLFREGQYRIRAFYNYGEHRIASNEFGFAVASPEGFDAAAFKRTERLDIRKFLYEKGIANPPEAMSASFEKLAAMNPEPRVNALYESCMARRAGKKGKSLVKKSEREWQIDTLPADVEAATAHLERAVDYFRKKDKADKGIERENFAYRRNCENLAAYYRELAEAEKARQLIETLVADLAGRNVKPAVTEKIKQAWGLHEDKPV